ncbi:hypothetical protein RIF29_16775 [Crotalaria pallida]|uniref:Uncharacterized protein n=1 Tax=Crotalaria pallida TaxID=3830 RepID=A0AAN9FLQ0_CROPI
MIDISLTVRGYITMLCHPASCISPGAWIEKIESIVVEDIVSPSYLREGDWISTWILQGRGLDAELL